MRNQLLVHPFQNEDSTYFSVLNVYNGTIRRFEDRCHTRHEANQVLGYLLEMGDGIGYWETLHQERFLGMLSWTPDVLFTDQVHPYSLRIATERDRAYRLSCQLGACTFVHPTRFATESSARYAQRTFDLAELADWELIDEATMPTEHPRFEVPAFEIQRDDAITYRIEMVAPAAIYRHPDTFSTRDKAQTTLEQILEHHGRTDDKDRTSIADPSRVIQALDGESEPWEYDPQARKKSRPFAFFNLGLGRGIWANGFAVWNFDRFRGTSMLQKGATVRVTATPSLYRDKVQWRVHDFQLVSPAVPDTEAA